MVDDKKSSDNIAAYAEKAGVPYFSYAVPGAVHSMVDVAHEEYVAVFAAAAPEITRSIENQKYYSDLLTHRKQGAAAIADIANGSVIKLGSNR